jgi:hypothetical protein
MLKRKGYRERTAPGALLRRHVKEGYQEINGSTGIDDYRFAPYRKDH